MSSDTVRAVILPDEPWDTEDGTFTAIRIAVIELMSLGGREVTLRRVEEEVWTSETFGAYAVREMDSDTVVDTVVDTPGREFYEIVEVPDER